MKTWQKTLKKAIDEKMLIGIAISEEDLLMIQKARILFNEYNDKYYDSELPQTSIYYNPIACGICGEYSKEPLNTYWYADTTAEHSIVLYPQGIESLETLQEVLLHEMAHEYCDIHEIKDIDRGRHTEQFANVCSTHGLRYLLDETDYMNTIL